MIIPVYNDWQRLWNCLEAFKVQSIPQDSFEIIVIDNSSDEECPYTSKLQPNTYIYIEEIKGSYAARNKGLELARGEIIAFTDSDCLPNKYWLENGIQQLSAGDISRIAGHIELTYKSQKPTMAEIYEKAFAFPQQKYAEKDGTCVTANLISFKSVFNEVGNFDINLLSGGDLEWGKRAQEKGYKIKYADNVIIKHPARDKLSDLTKKQKRVLGGNVSSGMFKKPFWWVRGIFPSIRLIKDLYANDKLTNYEKFIVWIVNYYLLLFRTAYILLLKLKVVDPKRS